MAPSPTGPATAGCTWSRRSSTGETPSTKAAIATLRKATESTKVLVVLSSNDEINWISLRNEPTVHLIEAGQLNTYDVLVADEVVFTKEALDEFLGVPAETSEEGRQVSTIADPRDIIVAPVVSEKSYSVLDQNWYTFLVHPDANKTQIKIAIQQIFNVRVLTVNTANREGKRKRTRTGFGQRKATKRAMVKLADGDRIEAFGGPVS